MMKRMIYFSVIMAVLHLPVTATADENKKTNNDAVSREIASANEMTKVLNRVNELSALAKDEESAKKMAAEMDVLFTRLEAWGDQDVQKLPQELVTPEVKAAYTEMVEAAKKMEKLSVNDKYIDFAVKAYRARKVLQNMIRDIEDGAEKEFHKKYANVYKQVRPLWRNKAEFSLKKAEFLEMFKKAYKAEDRDCISSGIDFCFPVDNKKPPTLVCIRKQEQMWTFYIVADGKLAYGEESTDDKATAEENTPEVKITQAKDTFIEDEATRSVKQKEACIANMKQIEGAVEQALLSGIKNPKINDILGADKYIRVMPLCPTCNAPYTKICPTECPGKVPGHVLPY